jgi:glycine cleavage system regulatory protein
MQECQWLKPQLVAQIEFSVKTHGVQLGKLVSERMTEPPEIDPEFQAQANRRSPDGKN